MPVSLKKLRELQVKTIKVKPVSTVVRRPRKNEKADWIVRINGKQIGPIHSTSEAATQYIYGNDLQKELPVIERRKIKNN